MVSSTQHPMNDSPPLRRRCGAKKRDGTPCMANPMPNGRCRLHGGKSPIGTASGTYKHGLRSKLRSVLPANMREVHDAVVNDPSRIEMTEHLGVLNSMLFDSISKWSDGAAAVFPDLRQSWSQFRIEMAKGQRMNKETMAQLGAKIGELIDTGHADYLARDETRSIIQDIRRVSDTERRRLVAAEQMTSNDAVAVLVTNLVNIVLEEVTDTVAQGRIHKRFAELLGVYRAERIDKME